MHKEKSTVKNDIDFLNVLPNNKNGKKRFSVKKIICIVLIITVLLVIATGLTVYFVKKHQAELLKQENTRKANECIQLLYLNLSSDEKKEEIAACDLSISDLTEDQTLLFTYELGKKFIDVVDNYYDTTDFNDEIIEKLDNLENESSQIVKKYRKLFINEINKFREIRDSYQKTYEDVIKLTNDLNDKKIDFNDGATTLSEIKEKYSTFSDSRRKDSLNAYFLSAEEIIEKLKQEYLEEQKRISKAWTKLDVPYISQNDNKVLNGCEVSCLLMGLQYKGYSLDKTLLDFAEAVPKSDNPEEGFYLDIYGRNPNNETHWIAPEALRQFAISQTGTDNVINSTSWDLDALDNEVLNGNPVIIYLTGSFTEPRNFNKDVPLNLHVLLLVGYNEITRDQLIVDPWHYPERSSYWTVSYDKVKHIYDKVGKRSLVIR